MAILGLFFWFLMRSSKIKLFKIKFLSMVRCPSGHYRCLPISIVTGKKQLVKKTNSKNICLKKCHIVLHSNSLYAFSRHWRTCNIFKNDSKETILGKETGKVIDELTESLFSRYQKKIRRTNEKQFLCICIWLCWFIVLQMS